MNYCNTSIWRLVDELIKSLEKIMKLWINIVIIKSYICEEYKHCIIIEQYQECIDFISEEVMSINCYKYNPVILQYLANS